MNYQLSAENFFSRNIFLAASASQSQRENFFHTVAPKRILAVLETSVGAHKKIQSTCKTRISKLMYFTDDFAPIHAGYNLS